jgi:hypothetical protein
LILSYYNHLGEPDYPSKLNLTASPKRNLWLNSLSGATSNQPGRESTMNCYPVLHNYPQEGQDTRKSPFLKGCRLIQ